MKEIHAIQTLLANRNAMDAVSVSLSIFASMLSFITYSLADHQLAPAKDFSSLVLLNSLRILLNLLPLMLGESIDVKSSVKRIECFMIQEKEKK